MKKISKILASVIVMIMLVVCSLSLTACEEIKKLNVNVMVYNYNTATYKEYTITVDMYRHLAPETVDSVIANANKGYYDGTAFYKMKNYNNQIMFGEYSYNTETKTLTQNYCETTVKGEFKNAGTVGSDLLNVRGSIGLWRDWGINGSYRTNNWADTGRGTLYMPTSAISGYDGYFCIFAKVDLSDASSDNYKAFAALDEAMLITDSEKTETFVVYYTGEYNSDNSVKNNGLTFNFMDKEDFDDLTEEEITALNIFEPKGEQLKKYDKTEITIPVVGKNDTTVQYSSGAYIKSVKVI